MTTNEVIKGLECCKNGDCDGCPYKKYRTYGCDGVLREDALKHLQQQKCELEKLQVECLALKQKRLNLFERLDFVRNARTKAITEFAERLKPKVDCEYGDKFYRDKCFEEIDNLVKEMTEGKQ